jgi:membrane protease YdiL (CAAX protease family)
MQNLNQKTKLILYSILYWVVFIITPFFIAYSVKDKNLSFDLAGYILFYILLLAPLLFFIPYRFSVKLLTTAKSKFYFITFGLIAPYIIIYLYLFYRINQMEAPRF